MNSKKITKYIEVMNKLRNNKQYEYFLNKLACLNQSDARYKIFFEALESHLRSIIDSFYALERDIKTGEETHVYFSSWVVDKYFVIDMCSSAKIVCERLSHKIYNIITPIKDNISLVTTWQVSKKCLRYCKK